MTKYHQMKQIIDWFYHGLISEPEAHANLGKLDIHGGFNRDGRLRYTGYDYARQRWRSYTPA